MNKKSIIGIAVAIAIIISVTVSYASMSSTKSDNITTINQSSNSTNQVHPTTGKSYTVNLTESIAVKNP